MVKKRKAAAATTTATPPSAQPKKQQKKQVEEPVPKIEEEKPTQPPPVEQPVAEKEPDHDTEELEEVEVEEEEDVGENESEDEDEDPISTLIEPFTKEQLAMIVREAAEKHPDVSIQVRKFADQDTVHRKIFIHGLGWDTTTDTLIDTFKEYGEIDDCKAVTDKSTGKSKGYGFILFKTRSGARKALKEPQKQISGRTASCQLAALGPVSTSGAGGSGGSGHSGAVSFQTEYTQRKIYISNVSAELDPGKLTEYFAKFGEIEEGPLGIDKGTGKFKGFCLFVYKSVESARKALEEPHKTFEGHTLHCQRAIDGPKPGKGGAPYHSGGHHGRGGRSGYVRGENPNLGGGIGGPAVTGAGMIGQSMGGYNTGAGGGALNPALGQALTALLASQGAGLGLNNLLGTLGGGIGGPGVAANFGGSGGYGAQAGAAPGVGGLQSVYPNQQMGQGGPGRSQYGYNGTHYGSR